MSEKHSIFIILMCIITILLPKKKQKITEENFSCKSFMHLKNGTY